MLWYQTCLDRDLLNVLGWQCIFTSEDPLIAKYDLFGYKMGITNFPNIYQKHILVAKADISPSVSLAVCGCQLVIRHLCSFHMVMPNGVRRDSEGVDM